MMKDIPALFGSLVFNERVMRNKLPKDVYRALRKTIDNGTHLELDVANSDSCGHERMGCRKRSHPQHDCP